MSMVKTFLDLKQTNSTDCKALKKSIDICHAKWPILTPELRICLLELYAHPLYGRNILH